jgi:hypothetical protein
MSPDLPAAVQLQPNSGTYRFRGDKVPRRVCVDLRQPLRDSFRPASVLHAAVNHLLPLGKPLLPTSLHTLAEGGEPCKLLEGDLPQNQELDICGEVLPPDGA